MIEYRDLIAEEQNIDLGKYHNEIDGISENDEINRLNYELDQAIRENKRMRKVLERLCRNMVRHMYCEENMCFADWIKSIQEYLKSTEIEEMISERE